MATYTTNYHLEKPAQSDLYNIDVFNGNADTIDTTLASKSNLSNLATVESSSTASKAYSAGEYLVLNGLLYKVTSNIANGGTLTPGTNISLTSTGAQLKSLNDSLPYIGSDVALTLNTKFTSNNARLIVKYGHVTKIYIDATVGSTQIPAWETIATWTNDYAMNASLAQCFAQIQDVTGSTYTLKTISLPANGLSFSLSTALTNGHRYIISFTTVD